MGRRLSNWKSQTIKGAYKFKGGIIKRLFLFILLLVILGVVFLVLSFVWLGITLPNPNKLLERSVAQSTKIYDRTGKTMLYEIFTDQRRTIITLQEIPRDLIYATIVVEDKDFYKHPGFDLKGIARAIITDIINLKKSQGGSTITQQFIKNALLTNEKSYTRKIRELLLAYQIEKSFTKDQILQMYFNEIPYGSTAYGIEEAGQMYFGKSAHDLTLDESALLAAIPKAPSYYSPIGEHREELVARKNFILDLMVKEGYLDAERAQVAKNIDTLKKIVPRRENILAPHFVMYVKELLSEKYGTRLVEQGGLKIITTLDLDKQKIAEEEVTKQAEKNAKNFGANNAALVAIDVKTGQILSMVGSKDFFDNSIDGQVNVALSPRQPGSSIKPIIYSAAFAKGYTPDTPLFDAETNFGPAGPDGKNYIPHDYDGKERGPVTMRQALAGSLNIPAVETLYLTGVNNVLSLGQKLGYTTLNDPSRYGLSLALGGAEVKLLEHTQAFATLAREGKKIPTSAILKVEDSQGNIMEEWKESDYQPEEVLPTQIARLTNSILTDNQSRSFIFGTNSPLYLGDRPVAAKTGTTNNWVDGWTMGFTPSLACGVWVGNNNNAQMKKQADGVVVAGPIWHNFMVRALADSPIETFAPPDPVNPGNPALIGDIPGNVIVKIDKASGKLATDLTPTSYIIEKSYHDYHSILQYINKDNPNGPPLENPASDPQYSRWEEAVRNWVTKNDIKTEVPPTEYDDAHTLANKPSITIISPVGGAYINEQSVDVNVSAFAPRGVNRVECFLDNYQAAVSYSAPWLCSVNLTGFSAGQHKIKVTAYDDVDNSNEAEINIILVSPPPIY
jgi:1A family penicillin-binding protein